MYKYTIIIPAFNSGRTIGRAIDSVFRQTYKEWELIVVNDGSTDDTADIINGFRRIDNRVRLINQNNLGPGMARNMGIQNAKGDYIAFLDADDYYEADYLECIEKINAETKRDVIFIDFINEYLDGKVYDSSSIFCYKNNTKHELIAKQMTGLLPWGPVVKVVSIEIAKMCKFSKLDVGEEAIYSYDVLSYSNEIGFVEQPKYHYVHNEEGQHKKGGLDPWGPVVSALLQHLRKKDTFEEYQTSINSFAIRALCINVYRCACAYDRRQAIREMKNAYQKYLSEYDLSNYDKETVDKNSLIILTALKFHMFHLIWIASMIRKK